MNQTEASSLRHEDQSYDELPYESYTFPITHPQRMAILAKLYGYNIPDIHTARVLEIGCAGGWNILPLAYDLPDANFVGIDLSPVQIDDALADKDGLNLKNIDFHAMDLMDFTEKDFGKFDYIITHGVFSWVPDFVRDKILQIHEEQLTDNGLACISYNVMPGWGALGAIRQMLLRHTQGLETTKDKVMHAKQLLEILKDSALPNNAMKPYIEATVENVNSAGNDSYLYHEFLEDNNTPYFFTDFHKLIQGHSLTYVGDTDFKQMYMKNLGERAENNLQNIQDPIQKEQYMDYVKTRQFRYSIVTKSTNTPVSPSLEHFKSMFYLSQLSSKEQKDTYDNKELEYSHPKVEKPLKTKSAILQAIILGCQKQNKLSSYADLTDMVARYNNMDKDLAGKSLLALMPDLLFSSHLELNAYLGEDKSTDYISDKPRAYEVSRYMAGKENVLKVPNCLYKRLELNDLAKIVLQNLDGTKTIKDLETLLKAQYGEAKDVKESLEKCLEFLKNQKTLIA